MKSKKWKKLLMYIFYSTNTLIIPLLTPNIIWAQDVQDIDEQKRTALQFTVKIMGEAPSMELNQDVATKQSTKSLGTGVIVYGKDNQYYVITNSHVLDNHSQVLEKYTSFFVNGGSFTEQNSFDLVEDEEESNYIDDEGKSFIPLYLNIFKRFDKGTIDLAILVFLREKDTQRVEFTFIPIQLISKNELEKTVYQTVYMYGYADDINKEDDKYQGLVQKIIKVIDVNYKSNLPNDKNHTVLILYQGESKKGMSGGPIINEQRDLIGINRGPSSNPNTGLSISVKTILEVLPELSNGVELQLQSSESSQSSEVKPTIQNSNNPPIPGLW